MPGMTKAERERAMLAAIPLDLIIQECARRGHQVCLHQVSSWHDEPLTEEALPFDADRPLLCAWCQSALDALPVAPLVDEDHHTCPVCGYAQLVGPPKDYLICPSCGTEFGSDDVAVTHEELRIAWLAAGSPWFSRHTLPLVPDIPFR